VSALVFVGSCISSLSASKEGRACERSVRVSPANCPLAFRFIRRAWFFDKEGTNPEPNFRKKDSRLSSNFSFLVNWTVNLGRSSRFIPCGDNSGTDIIEDPDSTFPDSFSLAEDK